MSAWLIAGPAIVVGFGAAGFAVGCDMRAADAAAGPVTHTALGDYVRIGSDNTVTVYLRHIEFGQGVSTGLTTIVAEEIDADWKQMRFEHSPADNAKYGNPAFGGMMGTGGSTAILSSFEQLRAGPLDPVWGDAPPQSLSPGRPVLDSPRPAGPLPVALGDERTCPNGS